MIDEHYFSSPTYEGGSSSAKAPVTPRRPPAPNTSYPPDIPLTRLGERERGFRGGTGHEITWPGILPMWFHYKNPVRGRTPTHFWPDCVPCAHYPETGMKNHGYLLPPILRAATATAAARSLPCAGGKGRLYRFRIHLFPRVNPSSSGFGPAFLEGMSLQPGVYVGASRSPHCSAWVAWVRSIAPGTRSLAATWPSRFFLACSRRIPTGSRVSSEKRASSPR